MLSKFLVRCKNLLENILRFDGISSKFASIYDCASHHFQIIVRENTQGKLSKTKILIAQQPATTRSIN
jgi:hypothetical protein